jgi:hypothetical protein
MKRLQLTPELIAKIKAAVGEDVDPSNFAVFENVSLNTLPLPGKQGGLFENARVSALTLKQMADAINAQDGSLPLMLLHDMDAMPVGRVFEGATGMNPTGDAELRTLFYVDPTEEKLAAKVDNGTIDEVSVQFLASEILCSECSFDYRGEDASFENLLTRTCANGHTVGEDGVHVRLVGLAAFTELSLVPRGAANKPKIVGKSQSKLAAPLQRLAAKGFEVSELFCAASLGEVNVDLTALLARNEEIVTENVTLKAQVTSLTGERDTATAALEAANGTIGERDTRIAELETELAAANEVDGAAAAAERDEAKTFLAEIFNKLAVAAGEENIQAPETIADLKAGIEQRQAKLSAILPVGGAAASTQTAKPEVGAKFNASLASVLVGNR